MQQNTNFKLLTGYYRQLYNDANIQEVLIATTDIPKQHRQVANWQIDKADKTHIKMLTCNIGLYTLILARRERIVANPDNRKELVKEFIDDFGFHPDRVLLHGIKENITKKETMKALKQSDSELYNIEWLEKGFTYAQKNKSVYGIVLERVNIYTTLIYDTEQTV